MHRTAVWSSNTKEKQGTRVNRVPQLRFVRMNCTRLVLTFALIAIATTGKADIPLPAGAVLQMEGGAGNAEITVTHVEETSQYNVYFLTDENGSACGDQDGEPVGAIPLSGSWGADMSWSPEGLTMACTNGPIGKCVTWGYLPWDAELRDFHQACIRMVRADYCGTGHGTTRDGTPIDVWDRKGINTSSDVQDMLHEADWDADGAITIYRTRFQAGLDYVLKNCPDRLAQRQGTSEIGRETLLSNGSFPFYVQD
ncbi:hypothetical protein JQV27_15940 [Sulfitobacter mediterraneus]|uniref:ADYC domain-containing protein n=1 Tax=Sulfitobacter mediterraneus TaxID=83219 RepID=UPI001939CF3A|nr:ADYC domain-containing protein [Sulfitobacter mediterraneus]MBM1646208.1 hypothetical protein [Sulfitobacter mediterraneus]MBM1658349.1 hypothetical protein [Sulfitobacter mediterraneus]MBM1666440.1 hypothetical protein [Sulfitobacter mediterraneus]MBM1674531.1 hypothetical protein [Sulfitobacter mediterraneus]